MPRIPLESGEIQVNFCKNPICDSYGLAASQNSKGDNYHLTAGSKKPVAKLICKGCGEQFPVKSNQGINEEINRLSAYLNPLDEPLQFQL